MPAESLTDLDFDELAVRLHNLLAATPIWIESELYADSARVLDIFAFRPRHDELSLLLRECYFASLQFEEQRQTRFVVSLMPEIKAGSQISSGFIRFSTAVSVDRKQLRRLAPIASPESSVLSVHRRGEGLVVAGMRSFGRHYGRPVAVSIAVDGPGRITVSFNDIKLMSLDGATLHTFDGANFGEEALITSLASHQYQEAGDMARFVVVSEMVFRAAQLIKRVGHGGAIWIARSDDGVDDVQRNDVVDTADLFARISTAVAERQPGPRAVPLSLRAAQGETVLCEAEDDAMSVAVAKLSATDGAVLLTMAPKILGFSSFARLDDSAELQDYTSEGIKLRAAADIGGGRHRSAVAFCKAAEGRAAIVVSQDGAVSLFLNVHRPIIPFLVTAPHGVIRVPLSPVGRGFAYSHHA